MANPKFNGLEKMSYKELVELQQRVEQAMVERKSAERAEIKRKMMEMVAESGFELADLVSTANGKPSSRKGVKVDIKYRNPTDPSQTWAGRGRQPTWLVSALKKGQKLEHFAV